MDVLQLRKVTNDDLANLINISVETFVDTFGALNTPENMQHYVTHSLSAEKLSSELNHPESFFYFAIIDAKIIGYLKLNAGKAQSELFNNAIEIERIYVQKEYHGKNVAQQLFDQAVSIAIKNKADYIWLGVWEHNARAIAFYTKLGFKPFGTHPFMLGDDKQIDVLMRRYLTVG